ncbi:MAG: aldehyde dehydrogenase family protein [Alicyclobacillus sp.]|nr:aldehyde dehydrogenase family protein [Alicyclobacillus sp.]
MSVSFQGGRSADGQGPDAAVAGGADISEAAVAQVYERARTSAAIWARTPLPARIACLRRLRERVVDLRDEIADVLHADTGKPHVEALATEVLVVLESLQSVERHAAKWLKTQRVPTPVSLFGKRSYVSYKPRGTVLVIAPWNFPFQLSMIPVVEALAAGNSVILKPSEVAPQVASTMAALFRDVLPDVHLVQVVTGGPETGARLVAAGPDFIHFTGSVRGGKAVQRAAAEQLIPTNLELGGKDPMLVFADAPLERAVHGALWGGLCNCGQVCMSVERLYVERPIYASFVNALVREAARLRGPHLDGNGADGRALAPDEVDIGPLTTVAQWQTVRRHVSQALSAGAKLRLGNPPELWDVRQRTVVPMIVTDVPADVDLMQEETFGPVLPVVPFDSEEEAVRLANGSRFGLSASVWTSDLERGRRVAEQLQAGSVCINDVMLAIANPNLPFGGVKEGGIGRYHGAEGLRAFSIQTSVVQSSPSNRREVNWFPYAGKRPVLSALIRDGYGRRRNWAGFVKAYLALLRLSR